MVDENILIIKRLKAKPDLAIAIYNSADQILHSRIQSFLITQSIFVASYVGISSQIRSDTLGQFLVFAIPIIAMFLCIMQMSKMLRIHKKLGAMNRQLQIAVEPFRIFMSAGENSFDDGTNEPKVIGRNERFSREAYTRTTPMAFMFFWGAALAAACWG